MKHSALEVITVYMTAGLVVFLVVIAVDLTALTLDGWLFMFFGEHATITHFVRTHQWAGVVPLGWQLIGLLGLACHFYPSLTEWA